MTFSAVGTIVGTTNSTSFTWAPSAVGNFMLFEVTGIGTTSTPTSLSSSNATWTPLTAVFTGTTNSFSARVFLGIATSTSSATVTLGWSAAAPSTDGSAGQEFSSTVGASSVTLDVQGHLDSAPTNTWPSLTATHGSGELYFGFILDGGAFTFTQGNPTGFHYQIDANSNGLGYNVSSGVAAAGGIGTDGGSIFGIAVLVYEAVTGAPAQMPQRQPFKRRQTLQLPTPAPPGAVAVPAPLQLPPIRRRTLARAVVRGSAPFLGFVAVPAPHQLPYRPPRRTPARAWWRGSAPFLGFVAVPAPRQQPIPAPRRRPSRAYVQFTPVRTTNGLGAQINGQLQPLMTVPIPRRRARQRAFIQFTPVRTINNYVPPIPSGVIFGGQSAGGDRDPEIRMFRSIMPGEVPVAGSQLPRLHGRGYAGPVAERAADTVHDWLEEQPPPDPGPSIAEIVSEEARRAGTGLYELGRILAPEPYVPPSRVKCGAIRKIGTETLRCAKKRGHPGMHADRGVRWG